MGNKYIIALKTSDGNIIIPKQKCTEYSSEIETIGMLEIVGLDVTNIYVISMFPDFKTELNAEFLEEMKLTFPKLTELKFVKSLEQLL